MDRGFYSAASAASLITHLQENVAHNLANVNTTAYKRTLGGVANFEATLGKALGGKPSLQMQTDFSQGDLYRTGGTFNIGIHGDGFLTIDGGERGLLYSRDGRLAIDGNGDLALAGMPVVGGTGISPPRQAIKGEFTISADGAIALDGREVGKIQLVKFDSPGALRSMGDGLFKAPEGVQSKLSDAEIRQGYLERSNVSVVESLVEMITLARTFDSANRAMQSLDEITRRSSDPNS